jgi:hypothetical protein
MCTLPNRRGLAVWLTLAALLFSALSPGLASTLFAQRVDILARVLGLPAPSAVDLQTSICHQDAADIAPGDSGVPQQEGVPQHDEHGVFCSFCLAAGAIVAVCATAPPSLIVLRTGGEITLPPHVVLPALAPFSTHRARAPPGFV